MKSISEYNKLIKEAENREDYEEAERLKSEKRKKIAIIGKVGGFI